MWWSSRGTAANGNTVTVNFQGGALGPDIRILEYAGLDTASPVDATAAATGSSATSSSGTVTTTHASDLLVAANYTQNGTQGAGTGFTSRVSSSNHNIAEDETVSTAGSYGATAPLSSGGGWWVMQIVAFKVASGMSARFVQAKSVTSDSPVFAPMTVLVPFAQEQTGGDLNLVVASWNDDTAAVTTLADTAGNSYSLAVGPTRLAGAATQSIYYAKNIASASANTVTIGFNQVATLPDGMGLGRPGVQSRPEQVVVETPTYGLLAVGKPQTAF
jgi:hypothetical protein